jgi:chromosome segregation protein
MLKCQEEHHTLAKTLRNIERERESAWQQLQNTRDELTRLNEQVAWHNERLSEIKTNQEKTRKHVQDDEMRLENIHSRVAELLEEEKLLLADVNAFPVFEVQQELNNWHTHRIITQNALETSRQRYQDHHNRIIEAWQRLETYQSRFDSLEAGLAEIEQQDKILKEAVSKTNQLINDVERNQIDPLTAAEKEAEKSASALQKLEEHSLKQMIIAERQYTQLQLELSRRNDQLQNLQQRIEDDFGLVSYDYEQRVDGPKPLPFDDGTIEDLPFIQEIPDTLEDNIKQLKTQIRRIGAINPEAQQEYIEVKDRHEFLTNQVEDLESASKDLREVINELDLLMERDFIKTFKAVNQEFSSYFTRLFNGGEAKLLFSDDEDPVEGGIDIEARLPGQRSQGLALLSGGERSLTAVALIFALLKVSPTPFCILDEVDKPVHRFTPGAGEKDPVCDHHP